jgi:signal recognition particle subunit SRP54
MDGDTRGGAAISIKSVVQKPIKFISQGEKLDAIDVFYPDRMADRILGMGDIISLVEKVQQEIDEKEARKIAKKMAKKSIGFRRYAYSNPDDEKVRRSGRHYIFYARFVQCC